MATNTYVALDTKTVGTAVSSVTFTTIPQGYTDLRLVMSVKDSAGYGIIRYNGDGASTGLYSRTFISGNGSTATSNRSTNANEHYYESSTTEFAVDTIDYMNYTNTNVFKTALARLNVAGARVDAVAYLYRSTSAISSITITSAGGNIQAGSTFTIYGIAAASVGAKATGGTIYQDASYFYHVFSGNGTFTPSQSLSCDTLIVAGGGGGGARVGGGGGAGGYRLLSGVSASTTPYTITIGAGGSGQIYSGANATSGTGSTAIGNSASGGGYGGMYAGSQNGATGGSGGGANGNVTTTGSAGNSGSYSPVEGYAGGNSTFVPAQAGAGGGGGAGGVGVAGIGGTAGNGGPGVAVDATWLAATGVGYNGYIAGGGGGGTESGYTPGSAGIGGGGTGSSSAIAATSGRDNTGSGGGGGGCCSSNQNGGNGGSGLVIVRYAK